MVTLVHDCDASTFVDAGCGDGTVLIAVARANPRVRCIGVEIDRKIACRTSARVAEASLRNVRLITGDALYSRDVLDGDCVFAYLGGALHQALGSRLLAHGATRDYLTALYPAIGLPISDMHVDASVPLYHYRLSEAPARVTWDAPVSISLARRGGVQLTSRAAEVYARGRLDVRCIDREGVVPTWVRAYAAMPVAYPGVPFVCDIVTAPPGDLDGPVAIDVLLSVGSRPLTPSHVLITGASGHPVDASLPREGVAGFRDVAEARRNPAGLLLAASQWLQS